MPTYEYRCNDCNHEFVRLLRMAENKLPEHDPCPNCNSHGTVKQFISSAPAFVDPVRIGVTKQDSGFKEVLKNIHSKNAGSKLDTYL